MLINTDTTCFIFMQIHIDKDMIKKDNTCKFRQTNMPKKQCIYCNDYLISYLSVCTCLYMKNRLLLYVAVCIDCFGMYLALSCQESHVSNIKIILD